MHKEAAEEIRSNPITIWKVRIARWGVNLAVAALVGLVIYLIASGTAGMFHPKQPLLTQYINATHGDTLDAAKITQIHTTDYSASPSRIGAWRAKIQSDTGYIDRSLLPFSTGSTGLRMTIKKCRAPWVPIACRSGDKYVLRANPDVETWTPEEAKAFVDKVVANAIEATEQRREAEAAWDVDQVK